MAILTLQVPEETARVLREIPVPGNQEKDEAHVTILFFGKELPITQISSMLPVIYEITSKTLPFSVSTNHISTFPSGADGVPVIARLNSPSLHIFRETLCKAFDDVGLFYDTKFKTYKPHFTLAYASDPKTTVGIDIPEVSWGAHEVVLWGSDQGTGRLIIKFPLSLPEGKVSTLRMPQESVLYRSFVKLARYGKFSKVA